MELKTIYEQLENIRTLSDEHPSTKFLLSEIQFPSPSIEIASRTLKSF